MQTQSPKQYLPFRGKPLALYSFETFVHHPKISEIIVVCEPEHRCLFGNHPRILFALPGERRQDSVFNGLNQISQETTLVCIHDSARPFLSLNDLNAVLLAAEQYGAATLGLPVKNTIKESTEDGFIAKTLPREKLWEMYTPQVATPSLLKLGFSIANAQHLTVTDDNSLIELTGHPIKLVTGDPSNIKITTPEDLLVAEALYPRNLKNWEFNKEAPQNFCLERVTIAKGQGTSEDKNSEVKPTRSKTNFSGFLGIYHV